MDRRSNFFDPILLLVVFLSMLFAAPRPAHADATALWKVIHYMCVPDQRIFRSPWPCDEVDLSSGVQKGYAVVPDISGKTQVLVVPTARIAGIESPIILAPDATNYWQAAWQATPYVAQRVGRTLPLSDLGLAINSVAGRTQDQLHIHVDCLRADVKQWLSSHDAAIGDHWGRLTLGVAGHNYRVMKIRPDALARTNPFELVASAQADMGQETIVMAADVAKDRVMGFYVLSDRARIASGDYGHGEELLDHSCALLAQH